MPHYTTTPEAMAAGATRVDAAATAIHSDLAALRAEVETMLGGWRGEAAAAFRQVHQAFEEHAATINGALRHMHEALQATQRTYAVQESTQSRTLNGLAGRING